MAKKIDPKAKAKRQKVIASVGGVILLALLAFQLPRTLKLLHPPSESSAATAPAATTPSTGAPLAAPSLAGGNATGSSGTGGDGLADTDGAPAAQSGQLLSFGLFRTKDPFVQQLDAKGPTGAAGPTGATGATGASGSTSLAAPAASGGQTTSQPRHAAANAVVISVNGSPETVQVGAQFPAADPVFTLVSLTAKGAKVGIAGGSLESGAASVTLKRGKALTLLNTADGKRYVVRLLAIS